MVETETIEVRNLHDSERLPLALCEGFPCDWNFDRKWTWVAVVDQEIVGYLLAGEIQGIVMLMMVRSKDRHTVVLPKLFRTFLKDSLARGFTGYMVHFNTEKPEQMKLLRIAKRTGAIVFPFKIVCVGGKIADAARY